MAFHVIVLAGGSGTRLWPLSRIRTPKYLLPLGEGGATLLQATVNRVKQVADVVHIVTIADQADACREAVADASVNLIAEPMARGTGPALALATAWIEQADPDATLASVHADHLIGDEVAYSQAVTAATGWALETGGLAAVGVQPRYPSSGFGYIEVGGKLNAKDWQSPSDNVSDQTVLAAAKIPAFAGLRFVEKPSVETAKEYLRQGRFLWNSGLFGWTPAVFLAELQKADGRIAKGIAEVIKKRNDGDEAAVATIYQDLPSIAVDPLIFERAEKLTVVCGDFSWSDVGSWNDLYSAKRAGGDSRGNVLDEGTIAIDSSSSMVVSRGGRTVALVGTNNLVVVDTGDAVLVASIDSAQSVKEVTERLKEAGRDDLL